jgi:hypothetical protein
VLPRKCTRLHAWPAIWVTLIPSSHSGYRLGLSKISRWGLDCVVVTGNHGALRQGRGLNSLSPDHILASTNPVPHLTWPWAPKLSGPLLHFMPNKELDVLPV